MHDAVNVVVSWEQLVWVVLIEIGSLKPRRYLERVEMSNPDDLGNETACKEQFVICNKHFEDIKNTLTTIDKTLRGNGSPGIKHRLNNVEDTQRNFTRALWVVFSILMAGSVKILFFQ